MTEEFIVKYKKKVAEFLGVGQFADFHSDWNWVHKIIDKIEATHDEFHGYFGVYNSSNQCTIQGSKFDPVKHHAYFDQQYGKDKKEATILAINNFIDFYNKNIVNKG
jgi:hypothetical protein